MRILIPSHSLQSGGLHSQLCMMNRPVLGEHLGNNQPFLDLKLRESNLRARVELYVPLDEGLVDKHLNIS